MATGTKTPKKKPAVEAERSEGPEPGGDRVERIAIPLVRTCGVRASVDVTSVEGCGTGLHDTKPGGS